MTSKDSDSKPETDPTSLVWAKLRLRVERASVPTLGELEGVKLVVETNSGGRLAKVVLVVLFVLALAYFGIVPVPW
ncbi:hypothetical protein [Halorussus caseinilyticus]|uniref:Uncharacterized protein n=1 Tax=Halorussus caseinilyticus TaxID=3034025 RepID=A0ABD5WHN7_9EURY|nr:hypothetical protein [Halorussus sp. DT72]